MTLGVGGAQGPWMAMQQGYGHVTFYQFTQRVNYCGGDPAV